MNQTKLPEGWEKLGRRKYQRCDGIQVVWVGAKKWRWLLGDGRVSYRSYSSAEIAMRVRNECYPAYPLKEKEDGQTD